MKYPLIFGLGGWEILLIVLVILLFVGGAKIPELMKGLGKGVRSFKEGINGDKSDSKNETVNSITNNSNGSGKSKSNSNSSGSSNSSSSGQIDDTGSIDDIN